MQKHRKAQTVEIGGTAYTIAPLTMAQIETWVEAPPSPDIVETRLRLWSQIEASMKNADPDAPSVEELRERLDLEDFHQLLRHVREISHLVVVPLANASEFTAFLKEKQAAA